VVSPPTNNFGIGLVKLIDSSLQYGTLNGSYFLVQLTDMLKTNHIPQSAFYNILNPTAPMTSPLLLQSF
jgi:hypothetical protein